MINSIPPLFALRSRRILPAAAFNLQREVPLFNWKLRSDLEKAGEPSSPKLDAEYRLLSCRYSFSSAARVHWIRIDNLRHYNDTPTCPAAAKIDTYRYEVSYIPHTRT